MNTYSYTVLVYNVRVCGTLRADCLSAAHATVRYAHPMADSITVEELA